MTARSKPTSPRTTNSSHESQKLRQVKIRPRPSSRSAEIRDSLFLPDDQWILLHIPYSDCLAAGFRARHRVQIALWLQTSIRTAAIDPSDYTQHRDASHLHANDAMRLLCFEKQWHQAEVD